MKNIYFYGFIIILSISFLFSSCASKAVTQETGNRPDDVPVAEILAKANALFKGREDVSKLGEAVNLLSKARNPDNRIYEVEWKYSKFSYFLGKREKDEAKAKKIFADGENAGLIASRLEPNKPDGYFWYGANLGEQAKLDPLTKGIVSIGDIKEAMNKVIEIQPDYEGASAYDALGKVELESGVIGGGDAKKAVEYLEKGYQINKENDFIKLDLAKAYLAVDKKPDAKKLLEDILMGEPDSEFKVEHEEIIAEAKELLEKRFK